ncbi:FAD-binding PCMH-type domain-containing protein [Fusarium sp. Ph1]|nr:FAD-binding PCMH-type domain-containing protein [Fusarium sp. Ph1]
MTIGELKQIGFVGRILDSSSPDYDASLTRANVAAQRKAKFIVFPISTEDVQAAIKFARKSNLEIAIKCGGHHFSPASSVEGGIVIDMKALNGVEVDTENMRVTIGGGCLWGDVYTALREHDLECVGGGVHVVGVGGHLTGGGYGPLSQKFGMACDNIISATIVLADGRVVKASESENSDLFWAIRGGSSSFGVVVQFVLRTFPPQGPYFFRSLSYQGEALPRVLPKLKEFLKQDFGEKTIMAFLNYVRGSGPKHKPLFVVTFFGFGAVGDFKAVFDDFFGAAKPFHDHSVDCPTLVEFSHVQDEILLQGSPRKAVGGTPFTGLWPGMAEQVWKRYVEYTDANPDAVDTKYFFEFHNSKRFRPETTCIPIHEPKHFICLASEEHNDISGDERTQSWVHDMIEVARSYQRKHAKDLGVNGNACSSKEKSEDVWGQNYPRLQRIKAKYDPGRVFNRYFPIEPVGAKAML